MNVKISTLTKKIFELGSFSKPILNYLLENRIQLCLKCYLKSLEFIWDREYEKALKEIDLGLKNCKENISLYYLLLSNKFIVFYYIKDLENMKIMYSKLRSEYNKIPPSIRRIINQYLINYSQMISDKDFLRSRFWSKKNMLSQSTKLFLIIGKARKEIKDNRLDIGIDLYQKGLSLALKIPHPSGIITCLNDIAWYLKDKEILKSLYYIEKGIYYLGFYYEDLKLCFFALDTYFNIQKSLNYYRVYETKEIIDTFKKDPFILNKYNDLLKESAKIKFNFNERSYPLDDKLIRFLKKHMGSVYSASIKTGISRAKLINILKRRVKRVKSETLRKFILGLNIDFEENLPNQIFSMLIKLEIDKNFEKSIDFLSKKSELDYKKLVIATYMALYKRKNIFSYLWRKNVLKKLFSINNFYDLKIYSKKNFEIKRFISYLYNPPILIKARKELILKFLNNLDLNRFNNFVNLYLNLKDEDRELFDKFIRNYIRFNKLSLILEKSTSINENEKTIFDLKLSPYILSLYYFPKWERIKFLRRFELLNKDYLKKDKSFYKSE